MFLILCEESTIKHFIGSNCFLPSVAYVNNKSYQGHVKGRKENKSAYIQSVLDKVNLSNALSLQCTVRDIQAVKYQVELMANLEPIG